MNSHEADTLAVHLKMTKTHWASIALDAAVVRNAELRRS